MAKTTLEKIKQQYVIVIPNKLVAQLHLLEGQKFDISCDDSRIILNRADPELDAITAANEKTAKEYRQALQRLADD